MYTIINKKHEYLTRLSFTSGYSFIDSEAMAYVYEKLNQAELVRNILTDYEGYTDLQIITI